MEKACRRGSGNYFFGRLTSNNDDYVELVGLVNYFSDRFQSDEIVFRLDGMVERCRFMDFEDKKKKLKGRKNK